MRAAAACYHALGNQDCMNFRRGRGSGKYSVISASTRCGEESHRSQLIEGAWAVQSGTTNYLCSCFTPEYRDIAAHF